MQSEAENATLKLLAQNFIITLFRYIGRTALYILPLYLIILSYSFFDWIGRSSPLVGHWIGVLLVSFIVVGLWKGYEESRGRLPEYFHSTTPPFHDEIIKVNGQTFAFKYDLGRESLRESSDTLLREREARTATKFGVIHFFLLLILAILMAYILSVQSNLVRAISEIINAFPWFIRDLYWGIISNFTGYPFSTVQGGKGAEFTLMWILTGPAIFVAAIMFLNYYYALKVGVINDMIRALR